MTPARLAIDRRVIEADAAAQCRALCDVLRARRERTRLTMTQVATQAGTSREMIRYWESGKGNPTLRRLVAWARTLDLTVRLWDEA